MTPTHQVDLLQENPEPREPESCRICNKHFLTLASDTCIETEIFLFFLFYYTGSEACLPFGQKETQYLYFKAACHINILAKIVWSRGQATALLTQCAELLKDEWKIVC